jgi:serine protease Do
MLKNATAAMRQLTVLKKIIIFSAGLLCIQSSAYADLPQTIEKVRASVVGVGTYQKTRSPAMNMLGTGFVVGDGLHVITNAHVKPPFLDTERKEFLVVVTGRGKEVQIREVEEVASDPDHDVAVLKIKGAPLPPLTLGDPGDVREGQQYAFTGFPIGAILGLYHVTHRATVSSLTPIVIPSRGSKDLDVKSVTRLRKAFDVFQLDATAYPGNSGSPLYDPESGRVIGVLNMVFVKQTKENVLSDPSGIAYAIPISHVTDLLKRAGVKIN